MKSTSLRMLEALTQQPAAAARKEPPDFAGWTRREIVDWQMKHIELGKAGRLPAQAQPPTPREQFAAWDARDAAILAERAAKAAAERLADHPGSAAAQIGARAAREAADKAVRAAEEAERLAEEAKLRPAPAPNPDAPGLAAAETKPKRRRPPKPKPEPEAKPKEWWEERAHWRKRSAWEDEDTRRGRPMYECLHEYDPIARFYEERKEAEDYDPFE